MPTYLGQDVSQDFIDMINRVYKEQFAAGHPLHQAPPDDDFTGVLEAAGVHGGPGACTLARSDALSVPLAEDAVL